MHILRSYENYLKVTVSAVIWDVLRLIFAATVIMFFTILITAAVLSSGLTLSHILLYASYIWPNNYFFCNGKRTGLRHIQMLRMKKRWCITHQSYVNISIRNRDPERCIYLHYHINLLISFYRRRDTMYYAFNDLFDPDVFFKK